MFSRQLSYSSTVEICGTCTLLESFLFMQLSISTPLQLSALVTSYFTNWDFSYKTYKELIKYDVLF